MSRTTFVTPEPVELQGFQAVLVKGKYDKYVMSAIIDDKLARQLEQDRISSLEWIQSKLKNPKRSVLKPEPWEEVAENKYSAKFSWNDNNKPPIVDTEGAPITDDRTPIYSGSTVKIAFIQKPYILKDDLTYGTRLELKGVQVLSINSAAGVDAGDMSAESVAELFGTTEGFKVSDPNVIPPTETEVEDDF